MTRKGRPRKTNGSIFRRGDSARWWMRYQDKKGRTIRESTETEDREEAERILRERLTARDDGMYEKDILKPSTVHREYRVLNRILNVAVQKKRLTANPC